MQVSPRFGIAYPITDRGVIHFSYGHFFQIPTFRQLYGANDGTDTSNPDLEVATTSGNSTFLSNADLKPQRTVQYEIGLSQQVTTDLGVGSDHVLPRCARLGGRQSFDFHLSAERGLHPV